MNMLEQRSAVVALFFVGGFALFAFVSLWASRSRIHWFWRAAAPVGMLTACGWADSHELVEVFGAECLSIGLAMFAIGCVQTWRSNGDPANTQESLRPTFSLCDLLLAMPIAGLIASEAPALLELRRQAELSATSDSWWMVGVGVGLVAVAAYYFQKLSRSPVWRCLSLILIAPGTGVVLDLAGYNPLAMGMQTRLDGRLCLVTAAAGVVLATALLLARAAGAAWVASDGDRIARGRWQWLAQSALLCAGLGVIAPFGMALLELRQGIKTVPGGRGMPAPNGYDEALIIGGRFNWSQFRKVDHESAPTALMASFVDENEDAIQDVLATLDHEWQVPLSWSFADMDNRRLRVWRLLTRSLLVAGLSAERAGRLDEAVDYFAASLRLSVASTRGGLLNDRRFSWIAVERTFNHVKAITSQLNAAQCKRLLAALDDNQRLREPIDVVIDRCEVWRRAVLPWPHRLLSLIDRALQGSIDENVRLTGNDRQGLTEESMLRCELALRQYRLARGADPETLDELVPSYLSQAPIDYFCGAPLQYARRGNGHAVLSVGFD